MVEILKHDVSATTCHHYNDNDSNNDEENGDMSLT